MSNDQEETVSAKLERLKVVRRNGAFKSGYDPRRINAGRKPKRVEEAYINAMYEVIGIDDFKQMLRGQLEKARMGDPRAAKELMRHLIGNPKERVEIVTAADGALERIQEMLMGHGKQLDALVAHDAIEEEPIDADQWSVIGAEPEENDTVDTDVTIDTCGT